MRDSLQEIGHILGIHTSRPERYVPHLSVLEVSLDTLHLWDVFIYYAFLNRGTRKYTETTDTSEGVYKARLGLRKKN